MLALPGLAWMARPRGADRVRHHRRDRGRTTAVHLVDQLLARLAARARYITAMLPFLLPPVAVALTRLVARRSRGVAWGLVLSGW
ncbi:MAG: hypothetical protein R2939_18230 [Kofleriaceae bacterium]